MCDVANIPEQSREVIVLNETDSQGVLLPASLGLFVFIVEWYVYGEGLR